MKKENNRNQSRQGHHGISGFEDPSTIKGYRRNANDVEHFRINRPERVKRDIEGDEPGGESGVE